MDRCWLHSQAGGHERISAAGISKLQNRSHFVVQFQFQKAITGNPRLKEKLSQKGESHNDFLTWKQITKQNYQFSAIHLTTLGKNLFGEKFYEIMTPKIYLKNNWLKSQPSQKIQPHKPQDAKHLLLLDFVVFFDTIFSTWLFDGFPQQTDVSCP